MFLQLETDTRILIKKAQAAREKYGMHAVIANELETRKQKVFVVTSDGEKLLERKAEQADIEISIVKHLISLHTDYIKANMEQKVDFTQFSKESGPA